MASETPPLVPKVMPPPDAGSTGPITGLDLDEYEFQDPTLVAVPDPPRCIQERLRRENKVWRWLSIPQTRKMGLRGYVVVSPDAKERHRIDTGRDTPVGVSVDEQNRIVWREDGFLAAIPQRLYDQRQRSKRMRTDAQTGLAKSREAFDEGIRRAGGQPAKDHPFTVETTVGTEKD